MQVTRRNSTVRECDLCKNLVEFRVDLGFDTVNMCKNCMIELKEKIDSVIA